MEPSVFFLILGLAFLVTGRVALGAAFIALYLALRGAE